MKEAGVNQPAAELLTLNTQASAAHVAGLRVSLPLSHQNIGYVSVSICYVMSCTQYVFKGVNENALCIISRLFAI